MPLPAPVTMATFPEESMFVLPCWSSVYGRELSRPFHVVGDALRSGEHALAGVDRDGFFHEQARADLQRKLLPGCGIGLEQPAEGIDGDAVVEILLLHAIFETHRVLDPVSRAPVRRAHVIAQSLFARRNLDSIAVARRLVAQDLPHGEHVLLRSVD